MTQSLFAEIWEALPFPIFLIQPDNVIELANAASEQLIQTSVKQMTGASLARYFGENSTLIDTIEQARQANASVSKYGVNVSLLPNRELMCNLHVSFLSPESEKIILIAQAEGMAQKMSRSLTHLSAARSVGAMAATLAHEIRNPLAGISGAAQLLAMNLEAQDGDLAEMIGEEAKRIGALVDRVEHFGDLSPVQRNRVNIHDIIDRAVLSAKAGYGKHISFIKDFDPSLPDAVGEGDQLLQVVQNLLKNAVEAIDGTHGNIRINTSYNSGMKYTVNGQKTENLPLQIKITDNGPGIPDSLIKEIFEPFVSSKVNGTGLGLSLVSKIMAGHGGLIECDSTPDATTFTLRLPIWHSSKG